MKLFTEYDGYKVTLIEQGAGSCLVWHHGEESVVVPLPEDVVFALMLLTEKENNA